MFCSSEYVTLWNNAMQKCGSAIPKPSTTSARSVISKLFIIRDRHAAKYGNVSTILDISSSDEPKKSIFNFHVLVSDSKDFWLVVWNHDFMKMANNFKISMKEIHVHTKEATRLYTLESYRLIASQQRHEFMWHYTTKEMKKPLIPRYSPVVVILWRNWNPKESCLFHEIVSHWDWQKDFFMEFSGKRYVL